MPICPRCGKSLSSEQALSYHLNRKYKCGTWKCMKCTLVFDTKLQLQIHEMKCGVPIIEYPNYDILRRMYEKIPNILYEIDNNVIVKSNKDDTSVGKNISILKNIYYADDKIVII